MKEFIMSQGTNGRVSISFSSFQVGESILALCLEKTNFGGALRGVAFDGAFL
jgi:hypothetical protein